MRRLGLTYTLYIEYVKSKDLPHHTGNDIQYVVIAHKRKSSEKNIYIYIFIYLFIYLFIKPSHCAAQLKLTCDCKLTMYACILSLFSLV